MLDRILATAALALAALLVPHPGIAEEPAEPAPPPVVRVALGHVDPEQAPVAAGLEEWVRQQVASAGLTLAADAPEILWIDLRTVKAGSAVDLRLHDAASGALRGGARGEGALGTLLGRTHAALRDLLTRRLERRPPLSKPTDINLDTLAAVTRALAELDAGQPARAWRELEGQRSSLAVQVRTRIEAAGAAAEVPISERARLLALRGEGEAAWAMLEGRARTAVRAPSKQNAPELLAAGDVLFELGRMREAKLYYERALAADSGLVDAALAVARIYRLQREPEPARKALRWAARIAPQDPRPPADLAALDDTPDEERARLMLQAGDNAAAQLRVKEATQLYGKADRMAPALRSEVRSRQGAFHERVGEHINALRAYRAAANHEGLDVEQLSQNLKGIARVQRALSDPSGSEDTFLRALQAAPGDVEAQRGLGEVIAEQGRTDEAVAALERAVALDPEDGRSARALAHALHAKGDHARALELMEKAEAQGATGAEDWLAVAQMQQQLGDAEAADRAVEQALEARPLALHAHRGRADALREAGNGLVTERARELALAMGEPPPPEATPADEVADAAASGDGATAGERLQTLVDSFAGPASKRRSVLLLGLREELEPREQALDWLRPRTPDLRAVADELALAIAARYELGTTPPIPPHLAPVVDAVFAFDGRPSRDPGNVARLNEGLEVDAVFVARLARREASAEGADRGCGEAAYFDVELRYLGGQEADATRMLANTACLPGGVEAYGAWNVRAAAVWGALLAWVVFVVLRGWGTVIVDFKLPPGSKALFAVSLSKRPRKLKDKSASGRGASDWVFRKRLESLSRFEHRLDGKQSVFRWIPARRKEYYLTVRGPLIDPTTNDLIGDFLEERTVRVRRWCAVRTEFDLAPKECAVRVVVTLAGKELEGARVAVKGRAGSQRFAKEGTAFVYLPAGEHVVVAAGEGQVAERSLLIETLDPVKLAVELGEDAGLVFRDCPDAVAPYMEGDVHAAVQALEAAGQSEVAASVRTAWERERGQAGSPSVEAGEGIAIDGAGAGASADPGLSAVELEESGDYASAGAAWLDNGDLVSAARAFETAYDYESALDCYQQLGDSEKVIELLERRGEYFEAAHEAVAADQIDRAIYALQQLDGRHGRYSEACRMMARLLTERGERDMAIEKFAEAVQLAPEAVELEDLERYAKLLEDAGRSEDALAVYEDIRRRDLHYGDVNTRIETLRKSTTATNAAGDRTLATAAAAAGGAASLGSAESRYEVLEELGRGGMGVVLRARDRNLGREVALKVLPESLREHPQVIELFEREARSAASLNHPNIVTVFDAGREGDTFFMTMECLDGLALDAILKKRGVLPSRAVAGLGVQVAAGLEYARQKRIVHRDIKPSNLFVTREKIVKIMDFGLAKTIEEVRRSSTVIGGTPNFMAPEQAAGEAVDHRTDLYALGASFFQLVTGSPPFEGGDLTYHHRHTPAPDPRQRNPEVAPEMAQLILELMAKDPADRVQTAGEVAARLQSMLG